MHQRKDYFYRKAKKDAYLARSVYKLAEMDEKFKLFHEGQVLLDLGTSPGSWVQYLLRRYASQIKIVGVDCQESLVPESEAFHFVRADLLTLDPSVLRARYAEYDGVLSDAAPNTSAIRWCDASRSFELCLKGWRLAEELLKRGGFFVCKIFQGEEVKGFQRDLQNAFESVRLFKPRGSRKESPEIYLVAIGKK